MGMTSDALFQDNRTEAQKTEYKEVKWSMRELENYILLSSGKVATFDEAESLTDEQRCVLLADLMKADEEE